MKEYVKKIGGGSPNVVPNRKPHSAMSIAELKEKAEKIAGVTPKANNTQLEEALKTLK